MDATTKDTREYILGQLLESLLVLKDSKPNDRSDDDRRFAITITEMEKVVAYYSYYLVPVEKS
jgi:hypothetical protein